MPSRGGLGEVPATFGAAPGNQHHKAHASGCVAPRPPLEHPRRHQPPPCGAAVGGGVARELPARPLLPHSASAAALFIGLRRQRSGSSSIADSDSDSDGERSSVGDSRAVTGGSLQRSSIPGLPAARSAGSASAAAQGAGDEDAGASDDDVEAAVQFSTNSRAGAGASAAHRRGADLLQAPPVLVHSSREEGAAREGLGGGGRHRLARAAAAVGMGVGKSAPAGACWGNAPSPPYLAGIAPDAGSGLGAAAALPASTAAAATAAAARAAGASGRWSTPFAGQDVQLKLQDQVQPQHTQHHQRRPPRHHHKPQYDGHSQQLRQPLLEPTPEPSSPPRPDQQQRQQPQQQPVPRQQGPAAAHGHPEEQPRHLLRKRLTAWVGSGKEQRAAWRHELFCVLGLALPVGVVDTVSFLASLVGVLQVGRLGTVELSALTLGSTLFNLTGLSWAVGLTGGMETLCGQMYGAGLYGGVGVTFQRALLVCLACGLPAYALWWQAESLLLLLGYVQRAAPCLALSTTKYCCRAYFTSQGVVLPVSIITFVATLLAPLYNLLFITWLNMGLAGAAWAYVADEATAVLLLAAAMAGHTLRTGRPGAPEAVRRRATWTGWDAAAWRGWGAYLKTALPSTAMSCLDWWVLEVMVLLSGLGPEPDTQVAAMGLCFNAFTLVYYSVVGFGDAACTRVSHMLGAGRGRAARRAALVALAAGLAVCAAMCGGLAASGPAWTSAFSRSADVRQAVRQALPYVAVAVLGYSANTVLAGVLRGAGRTGAGLRVNLVTLWLVGLPVAAGLGLGAGWGNVGLWVGIALMNGLQGGALVFKVTRGFNWAKEVVRSRSVLSLHASTLGTGDAVVIGGGGDGGLGEVGEVPVGGEGQEVGESSAWCGVRAGQDGEERAVGVAVGGEAAGAGLQEGCGERPGIGSSDRANGEGLPAGQVAARQEAAADSHPQPAALLGRAGGGDGECGGETGSSAELRNSREEVARWLADAAANAHGAHR
ncbi:hypothetical protein HXX76_013739 [Chlamydomonas incerta]|uniref:Protein DETOXIFICATION n=1 Tax=Chlamydomonas incerta TaxID=51695 RepID=A0A835VTV4_CHLIN|nr:hypothetical protein HXX76_013739 [Chlamydomonas incerta]|eukprot:KAG2425324.1 hypothetical protein HXX76_013739 [Chlamydomonas incerta]